jgi:shikimate dehydrogenase
VKRVYLLAHPAKHSLSPAMHNAAFGCLGFNARYESLDVPPQALGEAVTRLRGEGVLGANVTIPHKQMVLPYLDELSEAARRIAAVNTIISREGRLSGHNTDASGFLRALEDAQFEPSGKRAVMLGAGGAARAVAYALLTAGVSRLGVYNRTRERARGLAADFAALGEIEVLAREVLEPAVRKAALLVNTTSLGMAAEDGLPMPAEVLPEKGLVCDLIYRPRKTRLLLTAEAAGLETQNGLAMLVYQGAEAFSLWTNQEAPVAVMFAAVEEAL